MHNLILPHGGKLQQNILKTEIANLHLAKVKKLKSIILNKRQLCDIELILNGAFSPLQTFLNKQDYESVLIKSRLANDLLWPIPITLDITQNVFEKGEAICLRDVEGFVIAILQISDIWRPDKALEAEQIYGTMDDSHPGVNYLFNRSGSFYISGKLLGIQLPRHYDYIQLRYTPTALRYYFATMNWSNIVAFQTRNPMHRAHYELTMRAVRENNVKLLIHPAVGMTKPGDVEHFIRIRCYQKLIRYYPRGVAMLSLLPLAMRMAGPKEALLHAIIRKNYGANYFIIGRDHAGPGVNRLAKSFYQPYVAQELVLEHQKELAMKVLVFNEMFYNKTRERYMPLDEVYDKDDEILKISGTELRNKLKNAEVLPNWFSFPEIIQELRQAFLPNFKKGYTIFLTGLSGAGKSTIANALQQRLKEVTKRSITVLDGDSIRQKLSPDLGFSGKDRDINIKRIGFIASEITKHGGIVICACIAPYAKMRQIVRQEIEEYGGFFEIYVNTPLFVCESRDPKGLYAKVRQGIINNFTGIDDLYEPPEQPELIINTERLSVAESVEKVIKMLHRSGYLKFVAMNANNLSNPINDIAQITE